MTAAGAKKQIVTSEVFRQNLALELKKNSELRAAWSNARRKGCTELNLVTFLYAYSVGEELVIKRRRENRNRVLTRLSALAKKLDDMATDAEQFLNFRWWKDQPVSELLSGVNIEFEAKGASLIRNGVESMPISGQVRGKGTFRPDLILRLPQSLRSASQILNLFHTELGKKKGWDERSVGRSLYLANLVLYWQGVSGENPAWKDVAALVEGAAIAANSRGRSVGETALRLNFENFKRRNPVMFSDFEVSLAEYLRTSEPNISFFAWSRQRESNGRP